MTMWRKEAALINATLKNPHPEGFYGFDYSKLILGCQPSLPESSLPESDKNDPPDAQAGCLPYWMVLRLFIDVSKQFQLAVFTFYHGSCTVSHMEMPEIADWHIRYGI